MKVKKAELPIDRTLDHLITGHHDDIEDKMSFIKSEFGIAKRATPDYNTLRTELLEYTIELPHCPDIANLSRINELYAETQSYFSRVTAISVNAMDNSARWSRMVHAMEDYLEEEKSELLLEEKIREMKNSLQQAAIRKELKKQYNTLARLRYKANEAENFKRIVEAKKKDLQLVLTNLSRQVKALSIEKALTKV